MDWDFVLFWDFYDNFSGGWLSQGLRLMNCGLGNFLSYN
jgi:hypothetical protein